MRKKAAALPYEKISAGGSQKRAIPDDFKYNPKKLKHLKSVLHNVSVALGTLTSSLNEFSRLKGPEISPDGLLGGTGYILAVQDIKQTLYTSVHALSNVADSIADELTNPRWNVAEDKDVKELIKEKDDVQEEVPDDVDDIKPEDVENSESEPEAEPEAEPAPAPEKTDDQTDKDAQPEPTGEPIVAPQVYDSDEPVRMAVRACLVASVKTKS